MTNSPPMEMPLKQQMRSGYHDYLTFVLQIEYCRPVVITMMVVAKSSAIFAT